MDQKIASTNRIQHLDTLRVIACFFVLLIHALIYRDEETDGNILYAIFITAINIGSKLFFMLSGALLLPIRRPAKEFVTRRLKVVIIPLIIWSAIYIIEIILKGEVQERRILSMLTTPIEGALWFVYVMIGIYLLMPILSKCLLALGKKYIEYLLILWLISSFMPYVGGILFAPDIQHNMFSSLTNFTGYVILGYYLNNWPLPIFTKKYGWKFAIIFAIFSIGLPIFVFKIQAGYLSFHEILKMTSHDIGINTILVGVLVFTAVKRFTPSMESASSLGKNFNKACTDIAVVTFGTYLSHMLIYRHIIWPLASQYLQLPLLLDAVVLSIACFVVSFTLMRIIYLFPFSKYIIGH